MGIFGWFIYLIMGIVIFGIISFIQNKYKITKLEKLIISIILYMVGAGVCFELAFPYTSDLFLIFVFVLIVDAIYCGYFLDKDFFDKSEGNLTYYIVLIFIAYFINQEFINEVNKVFLTGEDLRIILWFLGFIFIYNFCIKKEIFQEISVKDKTMINPEVVVVKYAKLKYHFPCSYENKTITDLVYAIMIFEDNRRSKLLRKLDYLKFRLTGEKRKLGIMQIESAKFISDSDSIEIAHKKLEKLYDKYKPSRGKIKVDDIINKYDKENADSIKKIFDIISKF